MVSNGTRQFVASLDIGSSKVLALVAQVSEAGAVEVIGDGTSNCSGIINGNVCDMPAMIAAVQEACQRASKSSRAVIDGVHLSMSGEVLQSGLFSANTPVEQREQWSHISPETISKARRAALAELEGQHVVYECPLSFAVDGQSKIINPECMTGQQLEVESFVIYCSEQAAGNLRCCVEQAGYRPLKIYPSPVVAARVALSPQQRALGAALIDIGAGSCDLSVYQGAIRVIGCLQIGGDMVTERIARELGVSLEIADNLKRRYGSAWSPSVPASPLPVLAPALANLGDIQVSRRQLAQIVQQAYSELLLWAKEFLQQAGVYDQLDGGIVLTGGGARIEGLIELGRYVLDGCRVSCADIGKFGGSGAQLDISSTVALGLIHFGHEYMEQHEIEPPPRGIKKFLKFW